jgi:hypothetical protein
VSKGLSRLGNATETPAVVAPVEAINQLAHTRITQSKGPNLGVAISVTK